MESDIVQIFLESTFTGAEIMGFVATYTFGVAYILFNLCLAVGLIRFFLNKRKDRKNIQDTKDTDE